MCIYLIENSINNVYFGVYQVNKSNLNRIEFLFQKIRFRKLEINLFKPFR
jgi:hypothetical protein